MFENPRKGRQAKKFHNKYSENSICQIFFRTDIFQKLRLGAPARYTDRDDETNSRGFEALLSVYVFQRVEMLKERDCFFSAVAFQLQSRYTSEEKDSRPCQYVHIVEIEADQSDLQNITQKVRAGTDRQIFFRANKCLNLDFSNGDQFENNFAKRTFLDCKFGNATPLALANILQVSLVIISSIENFPVIPVIPRETTLTNVPLYIAYQRVGTGH